MQIWLAPINLIHPSNSPLCAVLVRMSYSLSKTNHKDSKVVKHINHLAMLAARSFPGNVKKHGRQDAGDLVRTEFDRLDFPRFLNHVLQTVNELHNEEIEWCLPIIDPEFNLVDSVKFVNELRHQKWLSIYVISDVDVKHFFGYSNNVKFSTETEFVATNIVSEAMDVFQDGIVDMSKSMLSIPNPHPISDAWNLGINQVL